MQTTDYSTNNNMAARPIGVFDSGVGGLTVAREIARRLPHESILYFGDTLRCPYGPRSLTEIRSFARQISCWLAEQDVKLIVIACNSATAAGLETVQQELAVPVIGVVEPGARAAVQETFTRRVGVIGTAATIESDIYARAIRSLDTGITTFSIATPRFVEIVEQGLRLDRNPLEDVMARSSAIYIRPAFLEIARDYLNPLKRCGIDTLVLGCTHYPLLAPLISQVIGPDVRIISSAEETARDVAQILERRGQLVSEDVVPRHRFVTTATDVEEFAALGSAILAHPISTPRAVTISELEETLMKRQTSGKELPTLGCE
ncbi:MAG: glutamate racemase [Coriobacteriales bacterium]|jgi:glutamate racemase|nr:glutamate racemase [Coriobacteriales bacterium]